MDRARELLGRACQDYRGHDYRRQMPLQGESVILQESKKEVCRTLRRFAGRGFTQRPGSMAGFRSGPKLAEAKVEATRDALEV